MVRAPARSASCTVADHLPKVAVWMRPEALLPRSRKCRRHIVEADGMKTVSIVQVHEAELRAANAGGVFEHALEHRLQIAGRPADHAQYFRRRRLLLQGFGKLTRSLLHLLEQPHIADRDHGLVGKCLEQGDLLVAERTHLGAAKHDDADALAFAQQGYAQHGANLGRARKFPCARELFAFRPEQVMHVDRRAVDDRKTGCRVTIDGLSFPHYRNRPMLGLKHEFVAVPQGCKRIVGFAQFAGALDNRREDRFDVGRRGGDHAKDVGAAGLVGEGLGEVARLGLHLLE
jgi:hypothetical protein